MAKSSGSREIGNPGNETLVVRRCRQPSITVSKSREGRKTCYLVVTASSAAATCPPPSPSLSLSACAPPFINIETAAPREGVHERDTRHHRANEEALSPEHRAPSPEPALISHCSSFSITASSSMPLLASPSSVVPTRLKCEELRFRRCCRPQQHLTGETKSLRHFCAAAAKNKHDKSDCF
jgi:hypothetical protein